jgi:hypothetical protein
LKQKITNAAQATTAAVILGVAGQVNAMKIVGNANNK